MIPIEFEESELYEIYEREILSKFPSDMSLYSNGFPFPYGVEREGNDGLVSRFTGGKITYDVVPSLLLKLHMLVNGIQTKTEVPNDCCEFSVHAKYEDFTHRFSLPLIKIVEGLTDPLYVAHPKVSSACCLDFHLELFSRFNINVPLVVLASHISGIAHLVAPRRPAWDTLERKLSRYRTTDPPRVLRDRLEIIDHVQHRSSLIPKPLIFFGSGEYTYDRVLRELADEAKAMQGQGSDHTAIDQVAARDLSS